MPKEEIVEIKNKKEWEAFFLNLKEKTFLQSWNWGEFQKSMGNKIWRLGVLENGRLKGVCLVTKVKAKRGTFLLSQHPVCISPILLEKLKEIGKKEKCLFLRIAPLLKNTKENKEFFKDFGFRKSPIHANAYEATWRLNLSFSEEDLLKNMRKTTRYLIRRALSDSDIEVFQSQDLKDVEPFYILCQEVAKKQKFVPFSLEFLKKEFSAFLPDNQVALFFAKYKKEIAAGAFLVFWSNIGFYHHAALLPKFHKIPLAYLLQWEAIKEAKKRNCQFYDFWGYVDPKKYPKHPWAGPTLFKMGFGGEPLEYLKTQDLPLSKRYYLVFLFETLRKIKRGL